jgi:feruloyl esterase
MYAGPRNPRTGEQIFPGLEPGSEASQGLGAGTSWSLLIWAPTCLFDTFYKYMVFNDPNWDFHTPDFDHDITFADAEMHAIIDSTSPDLSAFKARGGKLIMYHGWADPIVNSRNSINYFESVVATERPGNGRGIGEDRVALRRTQEYLRLWRRGWGTVRAARVSTRLTR